MTAKMTTRERIVLVCAVLFTGLIALSACTMEEEAGADTQENGQILTEEAFSQQEEAVPYPAEELRDSLERQNLRERLLRYNDPNKESYIYLLSDMGDVLTYYVIKGKVSSNSSQMTTEEFVIDRYEGDVTVPAPGDDGSYGDNEPGIFFFTVDGVMITWNGDYLLADAPMSIDEGGLSMTYVEGSAPTSVGE